MAQSLLLTLPVCRLVRASSRASLVSLSITDGVYRFSPGQAAMLGAHGAGPRRPYSIASSPADASERGVLDFLIGAEPDDVGSRLQLRPGSLVDIEEPFGSFVLPDPVGPTRLLLIAGGTGVAPLRSMWRHLSARDSGPELTLAYSVRTLADVAFESEIEELVARGRMRLVLTTSRERARKPWVLAGRFTVEAVRPLVGDGDVLACVCGPGGFVTDVVQMLAASGVDPGRILREGWGGT